jgi:hypothetical protein
MLSPSRRRLGQGAKGNNSWYTAGGSREVYCGSVASEISVLKDADQLTVYHMLHGLTNVTSQADRPVTSCERVVPSRLHIGIMIASLQADGNKFCDHIQLYKDNRQILFACQ